MAERPLLVLADERDAAAQAFVARHRKDGVRLWCEPRMTAPEPRPTPGTLAVASRPGGEP